jgi:hypothetical protein
MPKKMPFKFDPVISRFLQEHSAQSASDVITSWQVIKILFLFTAGLTLFCYDYKIAWAILLFGMCLFYISGITYRLLMVLLALVKNPELKIPKHELIKYSDDNLPIYTILLPMYNESEVIQKLIRAMDELDYPQDKLDIKILLEEDDTMTQELCKEVELPSCCEVIVCPNSFPKTKPKACNHGLQVAKGKYLVIYDAEDRPEPDQLRKAVAAFDKVGEDVVCLQGKLNYFNARENWLTKFFTLEYTTWFDLFLPGLHLFDAPIPLGGTSNHFKTDILKQLGGWDPFNVTEDCDLGIRLHRKGYRTKILDSTTWEEANQNIGNWIRQRSRWIKGYFQSHLVHTRNTLQTIYELGTFGFISFFLTVGGMSAMLILNPVFWITACVYGGLWIAYYCGYPVEPWPIVYMDTVSDIDTTYTLWSKLSWVFCGFSIILFLANILFIAVNVIACFRRNLIRLLPWAIVSPLYWIFISVAAWKGFLQLLIRPFYWEKTNHGLTEVADKEGVEG